MEDLEPLIDGFINGSLSDGETTELNLLLKNSREAREELRARIRIHGALAEHFSDAGNIQFEPILVDAREKRMGLPIGWFAAAAVVVLGLFGFLSQNRQSALGVITASENAEWTGRVSNELRRGSHELISGMVEFSIGEGVNIAVEGPAKFKLIDPMRMRIEQGRISADVGESAHGFTIETPEGKIIDLGTRFGVSVGESGATEAHVFEGEIDVVHEGRTVRLAKDEALELAKMTSVSSDPFSFPMPGHSLHTDFASGDFESGQKIGSGMPTASGVWSGDESQLAAISGDGEIDPFSGASMLQFLSSYSKTEAEPKGQIASEIWQIVDLRGFSDQVNNGGVTAVLSGNLNRSTNTQNSEFQLQFTAFRGQISEAGVYWDRKNETTSEKLASTASSVISDESPETWESLKVAMSVPPGTDFLLVSLLALENETNREVREFSGHFADGVELKLEAKARSSRSMSVWTGSGNWGNTAGWKAGDLPDPAREGISLRSEDELVIDQVIKSKQPVIFADHNGSVGRMRIAEKGHFSQSGFGELIVGFNEGGRAELMVQGRLETRTSSYIGRNNASSKVHVDGGIWDAGDSLIRMAQYGNRGPDTDSVLKVSNGGVVTAGSLELIHDEATLEIEDGQVDVEILRVGGEDGTAAVKIRKGRLIVDELFVSKERGLIRFESAAAEFLIRGELSESELSEIAESIWISDKGNISSSDLVVGIKMLDEIRYTLIRAKF